MRNTSLVSSCFAIASVDPGSRSFRLACRRASTLALVEDLPSRLPSPHHTLDISANSLPRSCEQRLLSKDGGREGLIETYR